MRAVGILDQQLTTIILVRIVEKERRRNVGADLLAAARQQPHRIVHMFTEVLPAFVTIEQRRIDARRQRSADEQRMAFQRSQDHVAQFVRHWRVFGKLAIVFHRGTLMTRRHAAIDPGRCRELLAAALDLFLRQYLWNRE